MQGMYWVMILISEVYTFFLVVYLYNLLTLEFRALHHNIRFWTTHFGTFTYHQVWLNSYSRTSPSCRLLIPTPVCCLTQTLFLIHYHWLVFFIIFVFYNWSNILLLHSWKTLLSDGQKTMHKPGQ